MSAKVTALVPVDQSLELIPVYTQYGKAIAAFAIVEARDAQRLRAHQWFRNRQRGTTYARCRHDGRYLLIHRLVLQAPDERQVDHLNGQGLDNRRANLRLATRGQNAKNRRQARHSRQPYKGIEWDPVWQRWRARIKVDGVRISGGRCKAPGAKPRGS